MVSCRFSAFMVFAFGAHDLGVARRRGLQIERTRAALGTQHHTTITVYDACAQRTIQLHVLASVL